MDLEHAIESKFARGVSTFGVPLLISVIGVLGGVVLNDMRNTLQQQGAEVESLNGEVREMKATLNIGLIWRIKEIERRINAVEQDEKRS